MKIMIYKWQNSKNQKLIYNYRPINNYFREIHIYGSASPVLHLLENKKDLVNDEYCLHHPKTIERQEQQNKFYDTL